MDEIETALSELIDLNKSQEEVNEIKSRLYDFADAIIKLYLETVE